MKTLSKAWLGMKQETKVIFYIASFVFSVILFVGILIYAHHLNEKKDLVTEVVDVGVTISADFKISKLAGDTTAVSATGGTFLVAGIFQAIKGNLLNIEVRGNGSKKLCDTVQDICFELI